jgi:hypothetical protein
LINNAHYVDTEDRFKPETKTELVRVNRKFFVYGQFTRYIRPGFHLVEINDPNSIAAYNEAERKMVILSVTGTGGSCEGMTRVAEVDV